MKHIILIVAYAEVNHLIEQLNIYDADSDFHVYIHWDKKYATATLINKLASHPSVKRVCSSYAINWGGRNLLTAMIALCQHALEDLSSAGNPSCFIHTISGTDILIHSLDEFKEFFKMHPNKGFMEYFKLPHKGWSEGGLNRLTLRHPLDRLTIRESAQHYRIYHRYLAIQRACQIRRELPTIQLYGGSCWWSLPRNMAAFWIQHANKNGLYERMEDTFAPEEIHPQTVLLNSQFRGQIQNTPLRYICWDYGARNTPALLENYDLTQMLQSQNFWARKIASGISDGIRSFYKWFAILPIIQLTREGGAKQLRIIADYLITNTSICPMLGLMDGIMGTVVFLLCYGKLYSQNDCIQTGLVFLHQVVSKRKDLCSSDFNNGTVGVAYTLAWLLKHRFIESSPYYNKLLLNFDEKILLTLLDKSLSTKLQHPFWEQYYQYSSYLRLRKLSAPLGIFAKFRSCISEQIRKAGLSPYKCSLGMAGIAGYGFNLLRELNKKDCPPFMVR